MGTWIGKPLHIVYTFTPTGLVVMRKPSGFSNPPQVANPVGVSLLTDTHNNAVATSHRACRWLNRSIALIALKLRDQLRVNYYKQVNRQCPIPEKVV